MFKSKSQRLFSCIVFGIYFTLLIWLVLFKLNVPFWGFRHARTINLIPFWYDRGTGLLLHLQEMFYNVLAFIPLGMYMNIYKPDRAFWKKVLPCFAVSFLFESLQFAFALGVSDVTDLITNTLGGVVGILLFALARKLFSEKSVTVINTLGLAAEGSAVSLLAVLLLVNG